MMYAPRLYNVCRTLSDYCRFVINSQMLISLTFDKFGNYFVQSLLKVADDTSYGLFIDCFVKDASTFARLATHAYGSHVVQLAIVLAGERKSASLKLVDCICKNVAYLSSDYLGAICLESAITLLPTSSKLLSVIAPLTSQLSTSRHGHMVVICALRNACSQTLGVMETEFAKHLESLVGNGYGFRVVIFALDMEKSGKINPKYSRVRLFIQNLKFSFHFFKLINHIILNFPSHPVVVNDLIPSIVRIVNQEKIS